MNHALVTALAIACASPLAASQQGTALAMVNDGMRAVRTNSTDAGAAETGPPPAMIFVPAGEVVIGTPLKAIEKLGDGSETKIKDVIAEVPRHTQTTDGFYIDRTEVTNRQWKAYLDATGREPSGDLVEYGWGGTAVPEGMDDFPIANVDYRDVMEFLAWAGKRLPTEAEWTMAARGPGDTRDYAWGERWDSRNCQSSSVTPNGPVEVGAFEKGVSPFGALNMCGNVWEWVDSAYTEFDGYKAYDLKKGKRSKSINASFNRSHRIGKGGSFAVGRNEMRIDYRMSLHPTDNDASLGFRGARSHADGVDVLYHGFKRLLPAALDGWEGLDISDVVAKEVTTYTDGGAIITGHRYISFAHPVAKRGSGLAKLRRETKDEPLALGLLSTSEALSKPALPAGDYMLMYKGKGESKEHKAKRKLERKTGKSSAPPEPIVPIGDSNGEGGSASAPWPYVSVDSIIEDVDFPQDSEVILFYNVNNAVVGYTLLPDALEKRQEAASMSDVNGDGKQWKIEFSLDNMPRNKKMPRFTIELELHGEGLVD